MIEGASAVLDRPAVLTGLPCGYASNRERVQRRRGERKARVTGIAWVGSGYAGGIRGHVE